ncbi:MAG: hypothetical protein J0M04_17575 [Verrucomicrobia bacterium]|nr:hypothetical protein [Verrucomicrobiota bacterium]
MRKFERAECPQVLKDKGAGWTATLVERGRWTGWPQHNKRKLNHILTDEGLRDQTQAHCSYCDMTPICPPGRETIDHFQPKSGEKGRLDLGFEWTNLFYCCDHCQQMKLEQFEDALLKPDDADYAFDIYFQWDFATGELRPNEVAEPEIQHRATRTIEIFKLSEKHPSLRLKALRDFRAVEAANPDDYSYRDFLERAG